MLFRRTPQFRYSDLTPQPLYLGRRAFLRRAGAVALGASAAGLNGVAAEAGSQATVGPPTGIQRLPDIVKSSFSTDEPLSSYEHITTYNNFYEFGRYTTGLVDARGLKTEPWSISVAGLVAKPGTFELSEFLKPHALEERIYRHRCVERWSAVIPWVGVSLAEVLKRFEPTPQARFVEFQTLLDPRRMPGQRENVLTWPYVEGLRLDEAMHPLSILAVGLYGGPLPKQDGAPIRLVVPWKYGFKSIKSIVKIRLVGSQPTTTWMIKDRRAYGFYSNVNPSVAHPGWSQATERRLGEFLTRKTLPFNGYAEEVASLYTGMDLRRNY